MENEFQALVMNRAASRMDGEDGGGGGGEDDTDTDSDGDRDEDNDNDNDSDGAGVGAGGFRGVARVEEEVQTLQVVPPTPRGVSAPITTSVAARSSLPEPSEERDDGSPGEVLDSVDDEALTNIRQIIAKLETPLSQRSTTSSQAPPATPQLQLGPINEAGANTEPAVITARATAADADAAPHSPFGLPPGTDFNFDVPLSSGRGGSRGSRDA